MAKLKTNSGAKKRFTLTGSGKIKRKHAYHSHILTKKTKKQKRNLDQGGCEPGQGNARALIFTHVQLERSRKRLPREATASKKVKIYA